MLEMVRVKIAHNWKIDGRRNNENTYNDHGSWNQCYQQLCVSILIPKANPGHYKVHLTTHLVVNNDAEIRQILFIIAYSQRSLVPQSLR